MAELDLIAASEVADGGAVEVVAAGQVFAVFRTDDGIHVLDGVCAHAGGPLGRGTLRDSVITCPWHGWQYDVRTGRHCLTDRICQKQFAVRVVNGRVMVEID
jgi:nitrite reductase/ring-hydroxylating ferredoxin subunit